MRYIRTVLTKCQAPSKHSVREGTYPVVAQHDSPEAILSASEHSTIIARHLLLRRKVMTNLDSIFKSRDITLPTKVCLVKAMFFPVVMYGCESWTV